MPKPDPQIVIAEKSLLRVLLLVAAFVLGMLLLARLAGAVTTPLIFILLAIVLVMGLNPWVARMESRWRIPRKLGALLIVAGLLVLIVGFIAIVIPLFVVQAVHFAQSLPEVVRNVENNLMEFGQRYPLLQPLTNGGWLQNPGQLLTSSGLVNRLVGTASNVVGLLASAAILFTLVLFLLMSPEPLLKSILSGVPPRHRPLVERVLIRLGSQLGAWLLGAGAVSVLVGLGIGIGLWILGFENAALFGMIAAFTNPIPFIGPWLGAIPPVLVALSSGSWSLALGAAGVVFVVQQLDSYVFSPTIYGRAVQLHPASLLMAVLLFGSLMGLVGVFLSVPLALMLKAIYEEVYLATLNRPQASSESVAHVVAAGQTEAIEVAQSSEVVAKPEFDKTKPDAFSSS